MQNKILLALAVSGTLFISGCASEKPPVITNVQNRIEIPNKPRPLVFLKVQWRVLNEQGLLQELVGRKMITQAQADEILKARGLKRSRLVKAIHLICTTICPLLPRFAKNPCLLFYSLV